MLFFFVQMGNFYWSVSEFTDSFLFHLQSTAEPVKFYLLYFSIL